MQRFQFANTMSRQSTQFPNVPQFMHHLRLPHLASLSRVAISRVENSAQGHRRQTDILQVKSFLLILYATLCWIPCQTFFYLVSNQSFPMQVFLHCMKPNQSVCSLLIVPCLFSHSTFLLTRHSSFHLLISRPKNADYLLLVRVTNSLCEFVSLKIL